MKLRKLVHSYNSFDYAVDLKAGHNTPDRVIYRRELPASLTRKVFTALDAGLKLNDRYYLQLAYHLNRRKLLHHAGPVKRMGALIDRFIKTLANDRGAKYNLTPAELRYYRLLIAGVKNNHDSQLVPFELGKARFIKGKTRITGRNRLYDISALASLNHRWEHVVSKHRLASYLKRCRDGLKAAALANYL